MPRTSAIILLCWKLPRNERKIELWDHASGWTLSFNMYVGGWMIENEML